MKKLLKRILLVALLTLALTATAFAAENLTPAAAQAYLEVLDSTIGTQGICLEEYSLRQRQGIVYVNLLDMTGDGAPEMIYSYFGDPYDGETIASADSVAWEEHYVSIYTYDGTEATLLRRFNCGNGTQSYSFSGTTSLTMFEDEDGNTLFYWESKSGSSYSGEITGFFADAPALTIETMVNTRTTYQCKMYCVINEELQFSDQLDSRDANYSLQKEAGQLEMDALVAEAMASYHPENGLVIYGGDGLYPTDVSAISLLVATANQEAEAAELLASLPYTGDISQASMSRAQASAFANVLTSGNVNGDAYTHAAFFDGGNGTVAMWAGGFIQAWDDVYASDIWVWNGTDAALLNVDILENKTLYQVDQEYVLAVAIEETTKLSLSSFAYYSFENGLPVGKEVAAIDSPFGSNSDWDDVLRYDLVDNGWGPKRLGYWENTVLVTPVLQAIAKADVNYTLPESSDYGELSEILTTLAQKLGGGIVSVYDLGDGVYYVIIDVSGGLKGSVICAYQENGQINYRIEETHSEPLSQGALEALAIKKVSQTNVELDFAQINKLETTEEFATYIQSALDNMDGLTISDSSKNELTTFMENAITSASTVAVSGTNNVVTLKPSDIADSLENAQSALSTYEGLLSSENIELNKGITLIIRIIGNQLNVGEPMEVILNGELADAIQDEMLQIYLGSSNHTIQITAENLKLLIAEYGTVSVQIQCNEDGTYTVNFLDEGRNIIEKMVAPVTIFLPCDHEFFTVMARYGSEVDNWGGQFSDVDNTISFSSSYTGIYELLDNSQTIVDIGDLPEDTQTAIQFMVSKGFFTVDENENFRPDENLARQDATKALVSMFFTLDRTLTCDFGDVLADSYYYSYIASAAADGIVLGYDDGTFQGGNPMTTEELLAIVSRTLVEKKGYFYPENPDSYLSTIAGADQTTAWAQESIALAIRD
ncbi:MAG: S-layer homology domain-containing protein, partial [Eubacteriales bacterium]